MIVKKGTIAINLMLVSAKLINIFLNRSVSDNSLYAPSEFETINNKIIMLRPKCLFFDSILLILHCYNATTRPTAAGGRACPPVQGRSDKSA